ncbi:alpha/beta fold hydrolase [Rugosimonospora acidiphila]|uniref:Alpha/beta fold hydrolase n=1 Tax=Rugosimonospora acidiphila TaxID=556531 RepID=A0ABP9SQF0_9ACTN
MRPPHGGAAWRPGWLRPGVALAAIVAVTAGALVATADVAATGLTLSPFSLTAPAAPPRQPPICTAVHVPVSLDVTAPADVYGRLCVPAGRRHAAIQVLVPGATYSGYYWDFPYQPETYSYVQAVGESGYATLNIDRIGYGQSSREPSVALTATAQALVLHQLVQGLRAGTIGGIGFTKVVLVGHSLGSGVCTLEAAIYRDVDGVVLTGVTHHPSAITLVAAILSSVHPASSEPKFGAAYDAGYVTTVPGRRATTFYAAQDTDPGVIATDEVFKDPVSVTELTESFAVGVSSPASRDIAAPVLVVVGTQDNLFCGGELASDCASAASLAQEEAPYFGPAARLQTFVLPGAGHDLNLELNAASYRDAVMNWAARFVPDA